MEVIKSHEVLQTILKEQERQGKKAGFVPTMGALHHGHASLIDRSVSENELTIASIFVNPAQFNDPKDLTNYPRTPEADYSLLESHGCDVVFIPSVEDMYPGNMDLLDLDFGSLATVMEGKFRKGHFQGMATIVYKLLQLIKPFHAYFGEKDFQQLAIIRFMVKKLHLDTEIVGCPTIRETDGLAMSSRNIHLTPNERTAAPVIYESMKHFISLNHVFSVDKIKEKVVEAIEKNGLFKVEYFEIVDSETLQRVNKWTESESLRACIAVLSSTTRLIDNIPVQFAGRS